MLVDVIFPSRSFTAVTHVVLAFVLVFSLPDPVHASTVRRAHAQTAAGATGARPARRAAGYAVVIAAMLASAVATTFIGARLPKHAQFMSQFVGQISTLGVFVFGAPIWEPMSSAFRKLAFDVHGEAAPVDDELEALWRRTQREYSLNEQMSRNVITSFLVTAKMNFYQAHVAMSARDEAYAMAQIAEAAVRARTYFADISPRDPAVTQAIRAAFTDHAPVDDAFRAGVYAAIRRLDPAADEIGAEYDAVLDAWLGAPASVTYQPIARAKELELPTAVR